MYWKEINAYYEYSKHEVVYKISLSQSLMLATGPGETRCNEGLCATGG